MLACFVLPHTSAQPLQIERFRDVLEAQDSDHKALPLEDDSHVHSDDVPPWAREKQRKALLRANLATAKKDSEELAELAEQVRGIVDKANIPAIPQECLMKLDRIDRLARKIREELRAY